MICLHPYLCFDSPESPHRMQTLNGVIGHYNGGISVEKNNFHCMIYNILYPWWTKQTLKTEQKWSGIEQWTFTRLLFMKWLLAIPKDKEKSRQLRHKNLLIYYIINPQFLMNLRWASIPLKYIKDENLTSFDFTHMQLNVEDLCWLNH